MMADEEKGIVGRFLSTLANLSEGEQHQPDAVVYHWYTRASLSTRYYSTSAVCCFK